MHPTDTRPISYRTVNKMRLRSCTGKWMLFIFRITNEQQGEGAGLVCAKVCDADTVEFRCSGFRTFVITHCKAKVWAMYHLFGGTGNAPRGRRAARATAQTTHSSVKLCLSLTLILRRSRTGTVWFYTSTSNKRAARPKLYTKSLTRDLKRMYSRLTLVRISINL